MTKHQPIFQKIIIRRENYFCTIFFSSCNTCPYHQGVVLKSSKQGKNVHTAFFQNKNSILRKIAIMDAICNPVFQLFLVD